MSLFKTITKPRRWVDLSVALGFFLAAPRMTHTQFNLCVALFVIGIALELAYQFCKRMVEREQPAHQGEGRE